MIDSAAFDYSDEQLRAAWLACRRASWPPTFEQAMADDTCSRIVRLNAWLATRPRPRALVQTDPQAPRDVPRDKP